MKKRIALTVLTHFFALGMGISQNFATFYNESKCGLNFCQASVLLGKRMAPYGYPYNGIDQPAPLNITGIPANSIIEKAFVFWDIAGMDTLEELILINPNSIQDTFPGIKIGGNNSMCWGPGYSFRADVTAIISGNGIYYISGLETDSTFDFFNKNDVTGATLFIIYSDQSNSNVGTMIINNGLQKIFNDTIFETINFQSPEDTVSGKAFMLLSDMQGETGNAIKMNNGPFSFPTQDFWDFEQKNTIFVPDMGYSIFGVRAPNDCIHLIATGLIYYSPVEPLEPEITIFGDLLTSSPGVTYQWYFNDSLIINASNQDFLASKSGSYYVEVSDSFGCTFLSDSFLVKICAEKIKPNINYFSPDSLWTDSVNFSLQWFLNGSPIEGANVSFYIAKETGSYWVQAQDSNGCSVNSNIVTVIITNENVPGLSPEYEIFPNPGRGKFEVRGIHNLINSIELYNVFGNKLHTFSDKTGKGEMILDLGNYPVGVYFVKISDGELLSTKKIIIY